jgi:hypothetical protein
MSITTTPTIPHNWTPTSSGCLKTSDYWIWNYESTPDARSVLGGPSQTINCLPPGFEPSGVYIGSGCPTHYTAACAATGTAEIVTCCPEYDMSH